MKLLQQVILVEGRLYRDGRMVEKGAVFSEDEEIPISMEFDWTNLVGTASNFTRDETTGTCYMDVTIPSGKASKLENFDLNVFLTDVDYEQKEDVLVVKQGRLRGLGFCKPLNLGWHIDVIEEGSYGAQTASGDSPTGAP